LTSTARRTTSRTRRSRLTALDVLTDYDWPGNVRELENVIERAVVLSTRPRIDVDLIPDHIRSAPAFHIPKFAVPPEGISFKDVITNVEKRLIESTLEAAVVCRSAPPNC
jgi:DNA-binding NtrC family response regulator